MKEALQEIITALKADTPVDAVWLDKLVRRYNRAAHDAKRHVAKRRLLPFYLKERNNHTELWQSWDVTPEVDLALVRLLQAKPRRTASGVAPITVITRPWPCSSDCLYCPSDIRMPKSYLTDEPACQRAERCWFDPYLQVSARLNTLADMGHVVDKIELIVLGGTWSDYPLAYQRWFIGELFTALNDSPEVRAAKMQARRTFYEHAGLLCERDDLQAATTSLQQRINAGELTYNQAWKMHYDCDTYRLLDQLLESADGEGEAASSAPGEATSSAPGEATNNFGTPSPVTPEALAALHNTNVNAEHRVVGLVIETRPDLITDESCRTLRELGCTKVQIGIQSLRDDILSENGRHITSARIAQAMALLRLYGFKSHIHFMVNLLGATPEEDIADYRQLVTDPAFLPDEVKLYPCSLVESSALTCAFKEGRWQPYREEDLVNVLAADIIATPAWTRISRMIRDISAGDIVAGNKKTNLRQIVEARVASAGAMPCEIRSREIAVDGANAQTLTFQTIEYATTVSTERFLQWVTPEGKIAGFLRLSLPHENAAAHTGASFPPAREAMIREVHVYGKVAAIHQVGEGAQHLGLGRRLVEEACKQAQAAGYARMNVISAVGTRLYYEKLGFMPCGLYQQRVLHEE